MASLKKYIPEGTRDILFNECYSKIKIENLLRETYRQCGYHEVISPTLEFYDVFNMKNQPINQENMYKLFDNKGRILVLRADMTTPIARIASTKIKENMLPMKLCYSQNIFRVNETLNGKLSEFTQSGIEIIGTEGIRGDVEAVFTAIEAIKNTGIEDFKIEIGDARFFKEITKNLKLNEAEMEKFRLLVQNKNISELKEFLEKNKDKIDKNAKRVLEALPELFGGEEVINEARELLINPDEIKSLENIKCIYNIMQKLGLGEYIAIDLGMVQNLNYYSGVIFKGYSTKAGKNILSGGRYDKLIENFGKSLPATGFAINIDAVIDVLSSEKKLEHAPHIEKVIFCSSKNLERGYTLLRQFAKDNIRAEVSIFDNREEVFPYCERIKCKIMIDVDENKEFKFMESNWISKTFGGI